MNLRAEQFYQVHAYLNLEQNKYDSFPAVNDVTIEQSNYPKVNIIKGSVFILYPNFFPFVSTS